MNYYIFKALFLLSLINFFCKDKARNQIYSKEYFFENYNINDTFKKEIFKGENISDSTLASINLKRKNINIKPLENGVNGFEFGFCFSNSDTISYYLVFGEQYQKKYGKLYKIEYNNFNLNIGQYPIDSMKIEPNSGWVHFFNQLYKLKSHKILNEYDPTVKSLTKNFTGIVPNVTIEFSNIKNYRIFSWTRASVNLNEIQNILLDKTIKLLYEEFNLTKHMPTLWENVKEVKG